jgi:hypothetical protein
MIPVTGRKFLGRRYENRDIKVLAWVGGGGQQGSNKKQ